MEHLEYQIDVFDRGGNKIGTKKRKDINKATDIFQCVKVILCTNDKQIVLAVIPEHPTLKNLYVGQFGGGTVATMVRSGETPEVAGRRALERELFITNPLPLSLQGTSMHEAPGGVVRIDSVLTGIYDGPYDQFSTEDIASLQLFTRPALEERLQSNPQEFSPQFMAIWEEYSNKIPF